MYVLTVSAKISSIPNIIATSDIKKKENAEKVSLKNSP